MAKYNKVIRKIEEVIDYTTWLSVSTVRKLTLKNNGLYIFFLKKHGDNPESTIRQIRLKLACDLVDALSLKINDSVQVLHNPHDELEWVVFKASQGRTLTRLGRTDHGLINFTWDCKLIDKKKSRELQYEIVGDKQNILKFNVR